MPFFFTSYAVYIAVDFALIFLIYFTFPETKNRTIEEIAVIFDAHQATELTGIMKGKDMGPQEEQIEGSGVAIDSSSAKASH